MRVESLLDHPQMALVLDMQRALSEARTEEELIDSFARRFGALTGATLLLDLDIDGLEAGAYRLRDRILLGHPDDVSGSPTAVDCNARAPGDRSRWHEPAARLSVERSPFLSPLLVGQEPRLLRELERHADPVLLAGAPERCDALLAPVFHGGQVTQWLLLIAPAGTPFDPVVLRMAIANLNLLSRALAQRRLGARVEALRRRLEHGLNEVARIQRSLLPAVPAVPGYDIAVHYRPAAIAGGDYYDFRAFDEDTLGIVVADVAGHGPGAAVVMAMLRTIMSAYRLSDLPQPEVTRYANRLLVDGLAPGAFVTAVFVALSLERGEGLYFNCGHCQPLLLRRGGEVESLEEGGSPPLGILPELDAERGVFHLAPGDRLVLYTDGVLEAPAAAGGDRFGLERLVATLPGAATGTSAVATLDGLAAELDRYSGDGPRRDDECALLIGRDDPDPAGSGSGVGAVLDR